MLSSSLSPASLVVAPASASAPSPGDLPALDCRVVAVTLTVLFCVRSGLLVSWRRTRVPAPVATVGSISSVLSIVDDITYRPPLSAGDPCRRYGTALARYTLGERTTLACETCGFADLSMSMGDRPGHDAEPEPR